MTYTLKLLGALLGWLFTAAAIIAALDYYDHWRRKHMPKYKLYVTISGWLDEELAEEFALILKSHLERDIPEGLSVTAEVEADG